MRNTLVLLAVCATLAACGGNDYVPPRQPDSGSPPPPVEPPPVDPPPPVEPPPPVQDEASLPYWNRCEHPRSGSPDGFLPYPDVQGTLADEKKFMRLYLNEAYLWYKELPKLDEAGYTSAIGYFNALKTPLVTASGAPKDRFHFTYPSAQWDELQKGVDYGYGVYWARNADGKAPRTWRVTYVIAGTAAALAGLQRGDQLVEVDGIDFVNASDADSVAKLNAGITPKAVNELHNFAVLRGGQKIAVAMRSARLDISPVQYVQAIDTPTGKVGYLMFNSHNTAAEKYLLDAFTQLRDANVQDLVLDMRYNGGGLLSIASQLSYMIAGPEQTRDKIFERTVANDKSRQPTPIQFIGKTFGYIVPNPAPRNTPLPYLGLKRVTILTSAGTCSASESVINSLRGVDVEVNLVGGQTCGKPYAFTPLPNCGTTYFAIQYQGINAKGFGDYGDGFAPTCKVDDDFSHALGDKAEGQLAAALSLRANGACPAPAAAARARAAAPAPALVPARPEAAEIAVRGR
jgi:carboxyl-terminal processing protease